MPLAPQTPDQMPVYGFQPAAGALQNATPAPSPISANPMGMLAQIMMGGPIGQVTPSPLTQALSQSSKTLLSNPDTLTGALSQAQEARDAASQEKMAAITRAMNVLSAIPNRNQQLQQLATGAGMLAPTKTGQLSESLGAGAAGYGTELTREAGADTANAMDVLKLNLMQAGLPEADAEATANDAYKRMTLGAKTGQEAMMAQYRDELGRSRMVTPFVNAATRLSAAQISGNKNRYQYVGPADQGAYPGQGWYLDKTTNQHSLGPLVGAKPVAPKTITPDAAMVQARKDYDFYMRKSPDYDVTTHIGTVRNLDNSIADPARWIANRAKQYESGSAALPTPASQPAQAPAPASAPTASQGSPDAAVAASLANARAAIAQGAPKEAVIQRLRQAGIDPSGL